MRSVKTTSPLIPLLKGEGKAIKHTPKDFFVIAHNIRSLYNVGSIFRTADAFGVTKIYFTGYTGTPKNPNHAIKISKSALGAEQWVPWEYGYSPARLIKRLKAQGIKIVALEIAPKSIKINKFKPKFPLALILGEEVRGVSKTLLKLCDQTVEIPMVGKKESLNVSVAFGIASYVLNSGS
jgi:23S rRNA (guanosine2251-2'-O)-methyltransferase